MNTNDTPIAKSTESERTDLIIRSLKLELQKQKELNAELVQAAKGMKEQIQSLGYYPECLSKELESLIKKSSEI